jgi:hypothetical protein
MSRERGDFMAGVLLEASRNLTINLGDAKEREIDRLSPHPSGSVDPNPAKINHP